MSPIIRFVVGFGWVVWQIVDNVDYFVFGSGRVAVQNSVYEHMSYENGGNFRIMSKVSHQIP